MQPVFSRAKKSLGQNFLVDQNYVRKIVDALDLMDSDTVVEIGPGRGAITEYLVDSGANVVAIELDRELVPILREQFESRTNFRVIEADATNIDFARLNNEETTINGQPSTIKLVANLPYYISTPILQHLSTQRHLFDSLVLMFQKEVVDRITAKPGDSERGFLTVLVEAAFEVEKLFDVPANAFRPVPKVTSSVARFVPEGKKIENDESFRKMLSVAFSQKRKTILNNLKTAFPDARERLERSAIDPQRRAESLTFDEWLLLFRNRN
ncbi:MAG TPA: 16S rRNA (adenine(1518)-N(6)/adenine(1519)-N(6))-dimethyltransferase RsmA [Pyrinomonadaceae bacterium]|nr:16S rRNA (adenine(1518)-N(6)/adenine(1519)-N(6))-dimethyltransferase RsmA [Pyrinomonadaceae bacterium]